MRNRSSIELKVKILRYLEYKTAKHQHVIYHIETNNSHAQILLRDLLSRKFITFINSKGSKIYEITNKGREALSCGKRCLDYFL